MRGTSGRWILLALVALSAVPTWAEAGWRWRDRRGGNGSPVLSGMPAKSDDAIQQTLSQTPAGGIAFLPQGVFRSSIVIDRPITIFGHPRGTTIDATGLGRPAIDIRPGVTDVTVEGVGAAGSAVEGIRIGAGAARVAIRRASVVGSAGVGLLLDAAASVTIELCTFDGNAGGGIDSSARGARLARLAFRANGGAAARLAGDDAQLSDSTFVGGATGLSFAGTRGSAFRCTFRDVEVPARFEATADTCALTRADVRGAKTLAVTVEGSIYATIAENRVAGTTSDAIVLGGSWHTVARNRLANARGHGIVGEGASLRVQENDIVRPAGDGVRLDGPGNTVDSNTIQGAGGTGVRTTGDACIVALNACIDGAGGGLAVQGLMNRVVSNRIRDVQGVGVLLEGDGNTLQDDVVDGAREEGIRVASGAGNLLVTNSVLHCGGRGLEDLGTGTVLERNRIE